jgi:hypothetical protein
LAKAILSNVQSVGEEGAFRRARLKTIIDFAIEYYRSTFSSSGQATDVAQATRSTLSISKANRALERCIAAQSEIDRNVTHAGLLESWATELAEIYRGS